MFTIVIICNVICSYLERVKFHKELIAVKINKYFFPRGLERLASNPEAPVKCLTSNLLQCRKRLGISDTSSQSQTFVSSVESECHSSPKWERDCQVRRASVEAQAGGTGETSDGHAIPIRVKPMRKWHCHMGTVAVL